MMLSDPQRGACLAIVRAPEAWSRREDVERLWGADAVAALIAAGVVEPWDRPEYQAVTLTPWGAWSLGVQIDEAWRPAVELTVDPDRPLVMRREHVLIETPHWTDADVSEKPVKLPRYGRIGRSLVDPESIPAPEADPDGPEFLTDEAGEPVRIFGVPVRIDRRLTG